MSTITEQAALRTVPYDDREAIRVLQAAIQAATDTLHPASRDAAIREAAILVAIGRYDSLVDAVMDAAGDDTIEHLTAFAEALYNANVG